MHSQNGVKQGFTLRSVWDQSSQPAPRHQKDAGGKPEDLMSEVCYIHINYLCHITPEGKGPERWHTDSLS